MLSKEAISSAVQEILLTADLKTLSSKQVREKLEQRFNVPLMSQREEIDTILMDIIAKKFFSSEEARGLDEIDSSSALSPDASSDNSSCDEASGSDNVSCKASGSNANSIPSDPDESDNLESSDSGSVNDEEDDEEIARRLQLEELGVRKRNVERRLSKSKRPARGEGAAPSSVSPKKRRSAYTQECVLSPELAAVMGTDKCEESAGNFSILSP
uniref:DEK_C domain-containing protein n=1 Tax=Trichuris muris TaxID=70415 RepID=A0A5S6QL95_TRIMR